MHRTKIENKRGYKERNKTKEKIVEMEDSQRKK